MYFYANKKLKRPIALEKFLFGDAHEMSSDLSGRVTYDTI